MRTSSTAGTDTTTSTAPTASGEVAANSRFAGADLGGCPDHSPSEDARVIRAAFTELREIPRSYRQGIVDRVDAYNAAATEPQLKIELAAAEVQSLTVDNLADSDVFERFDVIIDIAGHLTHQPGFELALQDHANSTCIPWIGPTSSTWALTDPARPWIFSGANLTPATAATLWAQLLPATAAVHWVTSNDDPAATQQLQVLTGLGHGSIASVAQAEYILWLADANCGSLPGEITDLQAVQTLVVPWRCRHGVNNALDRLGPARVVAVAPISDISASEGGDLPGYLDTSEDRWYLLGHIQGELLVTAVSNLDPELAPRLSIAQATERLVITGPWIPDGGNWTLDGGDDLTLVELGELHELSIARTWAPTGRVLNVSGTTPNCAFDHVRQTCDIRPAP